MLTIISVWGGVEYADIKQAGDNHCVVAKGKLDKDDNLAKGAKFGVTDMQGCVLIPVEYEYVEPIGQDCFRVKSKGKFGIINGKGEIVVPVKFTYVGKPNAEGFIGVYIGGQMKDNCLQGGKSGVYNVSGKVIVEPIYKSIGVYLRREPKQEDPYPYRTYSDVWPYDIRFKAEFDEHKNSSPDDIAVNANGGVIPVGDGFAVCPSQYYLWDYGVVSNEGER